MEVKQLNTVFNIDSRVDGWATEEPPVQGGATKRYTDWQNHLSDIGLQPDEHLLPRILCHCPEDLPSFMASATTRNSTPELTTQLEQLAPWDFWFQLAPGVTTNSNNVTRNRIVCRSHLISRTIETLLGKNAHQARILDMGCHSGFFSLDMASRGVQHITGVELREENIRQARFLQSHYALDNIEFIQSDIMEWQPDMPYSVVMNLGLLYHVIDPISLVRKTYDWCTDFAVIDTVCHKEPVSAYIAAFNKDTSRSGEGRYTAELHPTYRALIDTMHDAGFTDLIEVIGHSGRVAGVYEKRIRRCIIGFKRPIREIIERNGLA